MTPCTRPPAGWYCTLEDGHEGPCPARPDNVVPIRELSLEERYVEATEVMADNSIIKAQLLLDIRHAVQGTHLLVFILILVIAAPSIRHAALALWGWVN